jgi:hypothetical protein
VGSEPAYESFALSMELFIQNLYYVPLLSVGSVGDHTYGSLKPPPPAEKKNTFMDRWLAKGAFL